MGVIDRNTSYNLGGLQHVGPQQQINDTKKVVVSPFSKDSIISSKATVGKSEDQIISRPSLEKPENYDVLDENQTLAHAEDVIRESKNLTKKIDQFLEDPVIQSENDAYKLLIQCLKDQRSVLAEIAKVTKNSMTKIIQDNRQQEKEFMDVNSKFNKAKRSTEIASWVSKALSIASGIAGLAAFTVAALATGGAALAVIAPIGSAVLGISGGTSQIVKSALDHETGNRKSELIAMNEERELNNSEIKKLADELNLQFEQIQSLWSQQKQILQNTYSVAKIV